MPAVLLVAAAAEAQDRPPPIAGPLPVQPSEHQDSVRLTRVTSAHLPADGLLTVGLQLQRSDTVFILNQFLSRIDQQEYVLEVEAGLRSWLHVRAEVPWRRWSGGLDWIAPTGAGLGDGHWQVVCGRAPGPSWLRLALYGGGNLPWGDDETGLTEGAFSPHVGGAVSVALWRQSALPEMRLHLNLGRTWNRAEDTGYGAGTDRLQPWPARYQSAAAAGGTDRNDTADLGLGLEFRSGTTSLWLEYTQQIFRNNDTVDPREQMRMAGAGLRWGKVGGWALRGDYLVSLADDDETTDWWPGYPDMMMSVGVARQFGIGGSDTDGDGVRDRDDLCPDLPEDHDGFEDADGCPDYDNDQDGVPDAVDEAPNDPEDYDGFEDLDGAPDPDNDQDGVPDREDLCPDEPEDMDGVQDDDGCPEDVADRDGDGVRDEDDGCPDQAEDRDGFEDDDGCPEDDNDLDGIADRYDQCPNEPEDYNGVSDEDGCPDCADCPPEATSDPAVTD